jgi:hypothetical protein
VGGGLPVRWLNAREEAVVYSVLIVLMFAALVFPALAKEGIHIAGINPQSASAGDHVTIYGGGATAGGLIMANLTGSNPNIVSEQYLNNSPGYVGPGNSNFTLLTPGNFSVVWEQYPGNNTIGYANFGNSTLGIIFVAEAGTTLGQAYAGEDGSWRIDFVAPQFFSGNYTVTVLDNVTLTSDTMGLQLLGFPGLNYPVWIFPGSTRIGYLNITYVNMSTPFSLSSVSPINGPPGTSVIIYGRGASGRIRVSFGGNQVAYSDVFFYDYWSVSFQVPQASLGTYSIRVTDESSGRLLFTQFTVTPVSTPVVQNVVSMLLTGNMLIYAVGLAVVSGAGTFMLIVAAERIRRRRSSCS